MKLHASVNLLAQRIATLILLVRWNIRHHFLLPQREHLRVTVTYFSLIFGLFAVVVFIGNHFVLKQRQQEEVKDLERQQIDSLNTAQRLLTDRLTNGLQDILFLQELPELEEYANSGNMEDIHLLGLDVMSLLRLREDYDKIRLISPKGKELLRVEYYNGIPRPVPDKDLRDKSSSNYVKVGLKLKPGEVYISPFELNKLEGQLEIPHKPTFRLVSGAFNEKNELICLIVLNYLGKNLLNELENANTDWLSLWMMSADGCWIKEPGHDFLSDPTHKAPLLDRLGKIQSVVLQEQSGQRLTDSGLYSFRRFNPLETTLQNHAKLKSRLTLAKTEKIDDWIILSEISTEKLQEISLLLNTTNSFILFLILAPGAIGSWFLSKAIVLKHESDRKSREARDTLQQVTDSIPGAVYKLKILSNGHGHFFFLSRGTQEVLGLEGNTTPITYDYFFSTIIPTDRTEYERTMQESLSTGAPWACDFRIYDGNSCLKWIRSSASVTRAEKQSVVLSGIFTDITSLKIAEIKRRSSEERLDLALQAANDGLWDWNVAVGSIYFSARWLQMLGYESHELPHHFNTWKTLLHPDDLKPTLKQLSSHIENKNDHYEMEFRMRTKDGGWKWILSRGAVVQRDPLGRPERMIGTHTDISDRKELEKSLKSAKEAAELNSKTKSTFLAIMSHELRTPMNSVCGFADSLKHTELNAEQADYVSKIESSAGKLLFIINDILDYSKIEAGRLRLESIPFDLLHSIEETTEMLRPQFEEKCIDFSLQVEGPHSLPLKGDPIRLHQIVVNLLANAIKFTDHGKISLRVHSRPIENNFCEVEISVQDSGIGMSVDQQSVLFQPFSQVDSSTTRKYGGTGLGLAICKRLCEMMDGHIWVVSQPGQGSTFTFSVRLEQTHLASAPQPQEARKSSADTNRSRAPLARFQWKVLLVDHDPVSRLVATELLTEIGCEVEVIEDTGQSLTPEKITGCTALLLDEAAIKSGLFHAARKQVDELGIRPFYCFGLAENPASAENLSDPVDGWINLPVDIRTLSRAFSKAVKARPEGDASLAILQ
ncbi:MAG: hypothetical protein B9S32_15520 [Verrucomicrobia bacterium Tous-C9LFEB]|nr:MAG: hypothetical protein B9S32_15520 [Verrucomicrobia bacterium Tous-C9LFEB]